MSLKRGKENKFFEYPEKQVLDTAKTAVGRTAQPQNEIMLSEGYGLGVAWGREGKVYKGLARRLYIKKWADRTLGELRGESGWRHEELPSSEGSEREKKNGYESNVRRGGFHPNMRFNHETGSGFWGEGKGGGGGGSWAATNYRHNR